MKFSLSNKPFSLKVIVLTMVCCVAFLGMFLIGVYMKFFDTHKILNSIAINSSVSIDVFGAIIPIILAIALVVLYFSLGFSRVVYPLSFLFSLVIALLMAEITAVGLMSSPGVFAIYVSMVTVLLVTFFTKLQKKPVLQFKNRLIASILIASSCCPLSKIVVDFIVFSSFNNPTIGGNGLADGVLLSLMFSPFAVLVTIMILQILLEAISLIRGRKQISK
jgi:hypothetical protein